MLSFIVYLPLFPRVCGVFCQSLTFNTDTCSDLHWF